MAAVTPSRHTLRGLIASAGFASRDRFVVGRWVDGPLGPMDDVMWVRPDGTRTLLATDRRVIDFITAVYEFDDVRVVPITLHTTPRTLYLETEGIDLRLQAGIPRPIPFASLRTPKFTRYVEGPIARALLGVCTYGVSSTGVEEWYQADEYRRVTKRRASLNGENLGSIVPIEPPMRVGVSEPPQRPSFVRVRPMLLDHSGGLDAVLERSQRS